MKNEILVGGIKFWVDQDIIYCKIYKGFDKTNLKRDTEEIFFNTITTLSNGKLMPLLINMREINYSLSIKAFKYFSNNSLIKKTVLSNVFLVKSSVLKICLSICNFRKDPILPNNIFEDFDLAIYSCNQKLYDV